MEAHLGVIGEELLTALVLWAERLSRTTIWICVAHRVRFSRSETKAMNSSLVCRLAVFSWKGLHSAGVEDAGVE